MGKSTTGGQVKPGALTSLTPDIIPLKQGRHKHGDRFPHACHTISADTFITWNDCLQA